MNISSDDQRLKFVLDRDDLGRFDLTYEQLDYSDEKTRYMLNRLIEGAQKMFDFHLEGRLEIEVFPAPDSGCIVWFSLPSPSNTRCRLKPTVSKPYIIEFSSADDVMCAAEKITQNSLGCKKSELYLYGERYYLVVWSDTAKLKNILCEYGLYKKSSYAVLSEHGKLLCSPDALSVLA